jgi:transcriptional regulator with XRE-family HTH domain
LRLDAIKQQLAIQVKRLADAPDVRESWKSNSPAQSLHRTYYSGVERGIRNVSLMNIEKIAKGLRKNLAELFTRV